ncbi:MAG: DNA polymerase IV [Candidatus Electryonea clarkiae]|nr:DNA polymerase IV [Candidatus Electryonea clarkiae]MDP8287551.1 DNA polymerase IV [Candidatus Electryonea clarkiae]
MRAEAGRRKKTGKLKESSLILHVDMDAFFAAIEEKDNPSIKGKPVIIGGPKGSRGVVTTCNYPARKYGVHSGMSLSLAGRLCPDGIYLKTFSGKYTWVSLRLMALMRRYSPQVEPYSIDEAFLDATGCAQLWGGAEEYGRAVKNAIKNTLNLTASVGIGPSRIVAKMASDLNKPDGLAVIEAHDVRNVLGPLPVEKIPGVGESTRKTLAGMGIRTVAQLADYPVKLMKAKIGVNGEALIKMAQGKGGDKITGLEERPDDKSMGHEHTFMTNVERCDILHGKLLHLCDKATRRMRRENYLGKVVTLKLRTSNFKTYSHQRALVHQTDDAQEIYKVASVLLSDLWKEGEMPVRLIGISVSRLFRPGEGNGVQEDLFYAETVCKRLKMYKALDSLRDTYGEDILGFAGGVRSRRHGISV